MTEYLYQNYTGPGAFLFFGCDTSGKKEAAALANRLAGEGAALFFTAVGSEKQEEGYAEPSDTAEAVKNAAGCVMFLTPFGVSRLELRNIVNFILSEHKKLICFKLGDFPLSEGLDMQLANVPVAAWKGQEEAIELLKQEKILSQEVLGADAKPKTIDRKKKILMIVLIVLLVSGFAFAAARIIQGRIAYYQSPAYILRNAGGSVYLNASVYGQEGLDALKGMTITELDLRGAGLNNLNALTEMNVEVLDITDNPGLTDLYPLASCEGLQKVRISQDLLPYAYMVRDCGFEIIVEK